ncbi:hypothetical protein N9242_07005 [Vicingaceae bacterium]|nr:hypothetical protein [Vicingaceae bacterium]
MKKTLIYFSLLIIGFSSSAIQAQNDCDVRALKNELLKELRPDYKYDSFKATRFLYKNEVQTLEIAAPLFKDQSFRFLLNTAGLSKDIEIKFYDKKQGSKNRKELHAIKDTQDDGKNVYIFEPQVSKKVFLNYIIPRTTEQNVVGCMICVIGYKTK